jgi:hypothetical protein
MKTKTFMIQASIMCGALFALCLTLFIIGITW